MLNSITNTDPNMSVLTNTVAYYTCNKIECEKCDGTGYQCRNDGVYVICPICEGSGVMERKVERTPCVPYPCVPYDPPYNPWYPMPRHDQPTYTEPRRFKYEITCR